MRIANVEFINNVAKLYISGCSNSKLCTNCPTPQYRDYSLGLPWSLGLYDVVEKCKLLDCINRIVICGGDPFDSPVKDLIHMCRSIRFNLGEKIFIEIHTAYDEEGIKNITEYNIISRETEWSIFNLVNAIYYKGRKHEL